MADNKLEQDGSLDFETVFANLHRQAHDKELEALANLTLLRTAFDGGMSEKDQAQRELDERLQRIISDLTHD